MTQLTRDLPRKWNQRRRAKLLELAAAGASKRAIAKACGINRETLDEWLQSEHPELKRFASEFRAVAKAHNRRYETPHDRTAQAVGRRIMNGCVVQMRGLRTYLLYALRAGLPRPKNVNLWGVGWVSIEDLLDGRVSR